ncbi:DUF3658 domain-containing protein [Polaromonas sp. LjRoot131]|uniref:DUF3658 domain-containing protein n=1 Tax=Polaromonas sp. LjRoot131 TaxID=3342262 RepID=UPI003ECD654E
MLKREDAAVLYEIYDRAIRVLTESEDLVFRLQKDEGGKARVEAYGEVITDILWKLRAPLVIQYPDLDTSVPEGPPDTQLDPEEQESVDQLTPEQVRAIDDVLLAGCATSWRKVARVVGDAIGRLFSQFPDVPAGYYAQRVILLVQAGHLESQGSLEYMRYSEVRLIGAGSGEKPDGAPHE